MTADPPPVPMYGVVRADDADDGPQVLIDTADAGLARLLEILDRRPHLLATLADAANHRRLSRRAAVVELLSDPDVAEAFRIRLDVADATTLAVAIITAASPDVPSPAAAGAVGGAADRSANPRKDHR